MSNESTPPADQGRKKDKGKLQQVNKCLNEKKRREQENLYMEELAEFLSTKLSDIKSYSMIKPDKCAILQETVTQIRRIKDEETGVEGSGGSGGAGSGSSGAASSSGSGSGGSSDVVQQSQVSSSKPSPNILASDVIGPLLLEALDGFLFMVTGDGRLGFVSQNVSQYLRYTQDDLVGKSIFSIVDQVDHATFRKCLEPILARSNTATSSDAQGNRSQTFECNMLIKTNDDEAEEASISSLHGSRMVRMQILAIWQQYPQDREADTSSLDSECQSYLACIARRMGFAEKTVSALGLEQFTTKQDLNGKILDCDTSATIQGEPLCRDFVDTNILDFCHPNDKERLKKHHDEVLKQGSNTSGIYRFRMQNRFVFVQTKSKLFKNPTTNHPEFIMSTHSIVRDCEGPTELKGSLQASLMQAIIGGQSAANSTRDMQRGCHGNRLGRVSSVSSLSQMLMSDEDLPNDAFSVNEFVGMMSGSPMPENSSRLGGTGSSSVFQQQNDAMSSHQKLNSLWGMQFQGASNFPGQQHVGSSQTPLQTRRGMKRRATSPGSALRSPSNPQRSPVGYYSAGLRSPATKRLMTPSPLANFGQQQSYGAGNKNSSYLFPEEPDLSSLLDSVQDEGLCQQLDDHHMEGARSIRTSMTSRPISQGSGFDWESVSPPVLPPLQALQQLQVNSISTFKDDIHVFQQKQRRGKRDQNGSGASNASLSGGTTTAGGLSRSNSRPFQDLRLRELLINDDDTESLSGSSISTNDSKKRDTKVLAGSTNSGAKKSQRSADPESTKSPQWLMNPSPQQPQSTTFMDERPDSSSNKDSLNGQQSPSIKNKILKQLLSQEDDDDEDGEADPGSSSAASFGAGRIQAPSAMPVLRVLANLEGGQNQPDTSASPREQEREVEPTSNSGAGSSNNLLKKLLNSTDEICKNDGKIPKHTELLQKLLSDNSDDVADSNTAPIVESTSSVEMEVENKGTSSSSSSSSHSSSFSETSPVVLEEKSQFRRQNDPKGEKLKLMLKSLWENDSTTIKTRPATSTISSKNPRTSVDEAAADSTDFDADGALPLQSSSSSSSAGTSATQPAVGSGSDNKNKLLLKLLQGNQPAIVPVLNTGSISAVATVTPQTLMAKKAELMASSGAARTAESRLVKDHSSSESDLMNLEQAMRGRSSSSSTSVASPAVGIQADVNLLTEKAKAATEKLRPPPPPAPSVSIIEKLLVESENDDNPSLQDYFSGNGLFDGLMNNADLEQILDEVTSNAAPSVALGNLDDSLILSTIEQFIMSSSMSILEVDSLLQIGGDKGPHADPNEEVAIGEIQQQLMSMETISSSALSGSKSLAAARGPSSSAQPQFITLPEQSLMGSVSRSQGMDVSTPVNKASTISNLMKEFEMLESQENAALNQPLAQQPKQSGGQSRHVMNQLQKILTSRNQDKNALPQQQTGLGTTNARILGTTNAMNPPSLKSPSIQPNKTGFTLMETSSNDAGLVANLSEMMNVTHAPNVVAPPSGFRGSSVQPRLMSQSSVEGNLGQGQPGSDLQRALTSQYQWNQRGVSIMAGGALVQTNQTGLLSGSRPSTAAMPSMDEMALIGGSSLHGSESGDVIDELLASVLASPRLPSQQQLQMRMMQNQQQLQQQMQQQQQQQGAVSGGAFSEQLSGTLPSNRFRDPLIGRGSLKLSNNGGVGSGTPLQSPMTSSPRNNTVSPMMSPSVGSLSSGILSPMLDAANNLMSPSLGGNMRGGSPFSSGMMSPSIGMNSVFSGGHKTPGSYAYSDSQVDSKGSSFGAMNLDRSNSNRGNLSAPLIAGILHRDQGKPDLAQAPKSAGSGTSKDTKQALKLSIQSRTSGSQMLQQQQQQQQQQQRSPGSAGITSTSKADRISQYYLQTGSELLETQDDCSGLVDCFSPLSDSYPGQQHNASGGNGGTMTSSDSLLDMLGPRSQQLQQQRETALHTQYKRQGSLTDQRLLASKKLLEVQGMGAKQGGQMPLGIGQHLDQVLGVKQHLQQQQLADGDAQQLQLMMQAPEMTQSQSRHMMGFRQQPQVTGAKQQVTSINQIQHLGTMQPPAGTQHQHLTLMQQQQPIQHLQLGMMQQSGQHQQLVALQQHQSPLGMTQQLGHHQQLTAMQQPGQHQQLPVLQQQGQQQLALQQQQQQGQHQQLAVLQQQGQHQQLQALQQQQQGQQQQQQLALLQQQGQQQQQQQVQHQQLAGLGQQSSQNQQLAMMRQQQRMQQQQRQRQGGVSEMPQLLQLGGVTPGGQQQRLASQGMSPQSIGGQWGNMQRQQTLQVSPGGGQPDQGHPQMDMQKVPQSPSEFSGRNAEILQQLMAGIQQQQQQQHQPVGGNGTIQDAKSRVSALQSGGGALGESTGIGVYLQNHGVQLMSGGTSQCNTSQLMGSGYDTLQQAVAVGGAAQHHFLQQPQQQQQIQQDTSGLNGNLLTDDIRRRRDDALLYPNESLKKGRDDGRSQNDDFFRVGLQKLINEHVHKDSSTARMRGAGNMAPPTSASLNARKSSSSFLGNMLSQDSGSSGLDSKPTDGLQSPLSQTQTLAGSKLSLDEQLQGMPQALPGAPRPGRTALLEKLLSDDSG